MDRVVSLAPSATATLESIGATGRLVGVTAHCDVDGVPAVGGWLTPDLDELAALDPDLVLTADALQADVRDELRERGYRVFHHEPTTLEAVFRGFVDLGAAVGRADAGAALEREARERIARVRRATPDDPGERPAVYCEEWHDPPMAAGNWVPEAVEAAGGRYPFGAPGERSAAVDRETAATVDPAYAFVHHCGRGEAADPDLEARWGLDAEVRVIDDALLNQPSPRLIDGIELLAETMHATPRNADPLSIE